MKLRIYLDVAPWQSLPEHFYPVTTTSHAPPDGTTRYAFDVEIPDPAKPDVIVDVGLLQEQTDETK